MIDTQTLHRNFIMLHKFLHPNEALKPWVEEGETYTGHYHDNWNDIMEIIIRIASLQDWTVPKIISFLEKTCLPQPMNTLEDFYQACVTFINHIS